MSDVAARVQRRIEPEGEATGTIFAEYTSLDKIPRAAALFASFGVVKPLESGKQESRRAPILRINYASLFDKKNFCANIVYTRF